MNRAQKPEVRNHKSSVLPPLFPVLCLLSSVAHAGWYSAEILSLGVGSRAIAMGSAYTGVADDAFSAWWNPAGTIKPKNPWLAVMHSSPTKLKEFNFLSLGYPVKKIGFSIGIASLKVDSIQKLPDTIVPEPIGFFSDQEIAALLSCAYRYRKNIEIGINIKHIRYNLYNTRATGWGADIGICSKFPKFSFGLAIKDIGDTRITWDTKREDFRQTNFTIGAAYSSWHSELVPESPKKFLISADIGYEYNFLYRIGFEYSLLNMFFLRAGLNQTLNVGPISQLRLNAGMGIRVRKMSVDYSYSTHKLGGTHQISVSLFL